MTSSHHQIITTVCTPRHYFIGADTVETFKVLKYLDSTSPMKFLGFMTTKNGNKTTDSFPIGQFFYFRHFSFIRKHVKGSLFQAPR